MKPGWPEATGAPPTDNMRLANQLLLASNGIDPSHLAVALSEAMTRRSQYADIYLRASESESWSLESGAVKGGTFGVDSGFGLRTVAGEETAFAFSQRIDSASLKGAARKVFSASQNGKEDRAQRTLEFSPGVEAARTPLYASASPLASLESVQKVALLERIDRLARGADPRVKQVFASLAARHDVVMIARHDGRLAADARPSVQLSISVQVEQSGRRETANASCGRRRDYSMLTDEIVQRLVDKAVSAALVKLDARPAPAGTMTVVLGPGWTGVLLHEAVGHGLEGDFNRRGSSAFSGRIGERVAARGVTIVDDGTVPEGRGSLTVDDEGHPTQCTTLIEDGVLRGYMQDSLNARLMRSAVTGNARRESYSVLPMPRMTNTYMRAGTSDPAEIIASVQNGLYVADLGSGQVDITSGKFVFAASSAYLIENGKLTAPVRGATILGQGPEALRQVSMIGNDLCIDEGTGVCGKAGQSVQVGVGQPTLRLDGLTVGGIA